MNTTIIQQLHAVWLNQSFDHMDEIEIEFNAILKANKLPEFCEEFYEDVNSIASDGYDYFAAKVNKWTDEIPDVSDDSDPETDARERNPSLVTRF